MSLDASIFYPRHDHYYLETVVFKVETTLYRVPRFHFERNSGIFATTFSLPQPTEGAEGSSDIAPFKLEGISRVDFERLLRVLYPLTAIPKTPDLSQDEWISVLKLASLWDFIEVRNLAIEQLAPYSESLDCIERIMFARKYDVSAWLRSGYIELARRKDIISSKEAATIGWEAALQICELREATVLTRLGDNPYEGLDLGNAFQAEMKRADTAHEPLPNLPVLSATSASASSGVIATDPGAGTNLRGATKTKPRTRHRDVFGKENRSYGSSVLPNDASHNAGFRTIPNFNFGSTSGFGSGSKLNPFGSNLESVANGGSSSNLPGPASAATGMVGGTSEQTPATDPSALLSTSST
ncbi:hypothetical protein C8R45DRAFT_983315 [Mycena sanguinolenta]|nr:hypothetical protein C8R45DRAFT_983315 [Mycena sanguinolenta]